MNHMDLKKYILPSLPYVLIAWFFSKIAEGYRLCTAPDMLTKAMIALSGLGERMTRNPFPSLHPLDLLFGLCGAGCVRLVIYFRSKNAKKYRHGVEYGSAR